MRSGTNLINRPVLDIQSISNPTPPPPQKADLYGITDKHGEGNEITAKYNRILALEGSWDNGDTPLPDIPSIVDWSFDHHVLTCHLLDPEELSLRIGLLRTDTIFSAFNCLRSEKA